MDSNETAAAAEQEEDLEKWDFAVALNLYKLGCLKLSTIATRPNEIGMVLETVSSNTGKTFYVMVELKRACVTFVPTEIVTGAIPAMKKVYIIKSETNQVKSLKLIEPKNEILDINDRKLDTVSGFIATFIFRYDGGQKQIEYNVGYERITNVACDFYDDITDSESDSSDSDEEDSSDESVAEGVDENDWKAEFERDVWKSLINFLPHVFYRRLIVPRVLYDCSSRDDTFYTREDIPFIWVPSVFLDAPSWKIPKNVISSICEIPSNKLLRGCHIDKDHILFALCNHSLALYSGTPRHGIFIGRDLDVDRRRFDDRLNSFVVRNAYFVQNPDGIPPRVLVPTGDGFVVNEEFIYCKQHDHLQIFYDKDKFAHLEFGTYGRCSAKYDPELQRYFLETFELSAKKIEPLLDAPDKRVCFRFPVVIKHGFFYNNFFGIISVKPFRICNKTTEYIYASYVGNDQKYQTAFAENEEYLKFIEQRDDSFEF
uniref:Uncharacterized protein n=1 Tax=Panagrolaimus sp. ES5 TaxID=591445 RepID=A0AC34FLS7_9BILA